MRSFAWFEYCSKCKTKHINCFASFLVDSCTMLEAHLDMEGLFRRSGSFANVKVLQTKLDSGEECLSAARPNDLAGLLKQFFKDLPEPVLPIEMQKAFLKAQQLPAKEDRTSATMLISCLLPDKNLSVMRHFADFLQKVSNRSAKNKMNISNLSLVLAPTLLQSEVRTKMNSNTEKDLQLETAVIHCFIKNAHNLGMLPRMLGKPSSTTMEHEPDMPDDFDEIHTNSGERGIIGGVVDKIKTAVTTHKAQKWRRYKYKTERQAWFCSPKMFPSMSPCHLTTQMPNTSADTEIILLKHRML
ncbi:rho GTPase-activating protein 11B-like [Syngnathus acus]|uniref:rho GTPase-activating protein 11B-like n=1 Tax=Syngnathus acus TaxID=161584 RepID=UPI0018860384|nr:rho GTPase-activating protein 11B-like [Syngnathus acus]